MATEMLEFGPTGVATADAEAVLVLPYARRHLAGFHRAVDSVARERRYLAMTEAPTLSRTRRFVLDSLRDGAVHFVAVSGDAVVGWCDLRPKKPVAQRHSAVLGMGLVQGWRGLGLGTRLLASTLDAAAARGIARAELFVRSDNEPAIALYRRFDFAVEGTCRDYLRLDGASFDALLMARRLGDDS
jgi:ribosomal protein S18 acetylase RimI-like enzyme